VTTSNTPTALSLFSGIGAFDLAATWAGFQIIGQVEIADYPHSILRQHWPDVPKWRDIRDVTADDVIRQTGIESPTVIIGGFPCQPFSCAGKRKGKEDPRYLWPEMLRIVQECRSTWIVGENVDGLGLLELDEICAHLEDIGYSSRAFSVPAAAVEADHKRYRYFIVARRNDSNTSIKGCNGIGVSIRPWRPFKTRSNPRGMGADTGISQDAHDRSRERLREMGRDWREFKPIAKLRDWGGTPEPGILGDGDGAPNRVDRITALGNAVVPQQVYPILKGIADIEAIYHSSPEDR